MFTKAELVCGAAGFLIVMGMLIACGPIIPVFGLFMLWLGVGGIIISTHMHESN